MTIEDVFHTHPRLLHHLNQLTDACHQASANAGWWTPYISNPIFPADVAHNDHFIATKIGLIHSEVSEAFEAYRRGQFDSHLTYRSGLEVELADVIIRVLDLAGQLNLDVWGALLEKAQVNSARPDHKLEVRAKTGGKKF